MKRRRALVVAALSVVVLVIHLVLVRAMAHGHVAHVLLGAGNAAPPLGAAALAVSLVVVRLVALVLAPGLLLASVASLLAHVLVGPPRPRGGGDHSGTSSGAGTSLAEGAGISIEGRAT
jgi:hypothetical protein